MAAQVTFGAILRDARERKGLDLSTAARRLRIRPDILRAIEENDFSRMPPRGYTRNMVNAYARLVGLNPTEITRLYLDEAYAYQVGRARSDAQPTGFDMGGSRRGTRGAAAARQAASEERQPRQNAFGRTMYSDARNDLGPRTERTYSEDRMHPSRHAAVPGAQYTNFYAGPKAPSNMRSKLPFIIVGIVILVLLIVILVLAFGPKGAPEDDVENLPISGLTDNTQGEEGQGASDAAQQAPAPVAPTSAVFEYSIANGDAAYIEIYENDEITVGEEFSGPKKETYDVTGTLRIVTSNPDAVTVTVDGAAVEMTDPNDIGVYEYTVDFPAILEQWKADHPATTPAATPPATAAA